MVYRRWVCADPDEEKAKAAAGGAGVPLFAGRILAARGIDTAEEAAAFVNPLSELSDPMLLSGAEAAAARIRRALDGGEKIAIFGDYDADGVCSTALLYSCLERMGGDVYYKLPNRSDDGYGLSRSCVEQMASRGMNLIITVDNGVSAAEEIALAKSLGVDVVVTDHHLPPETLPDAAAIVDPKLPGDRSPFKELCGTGVAFKIACAVEQAPPDEMLDWYADLVAIGTIADMMPLTGENRIFVQHGMQMLQDPERPGLHALLSAAGLAGRRLTGENIGFGIAPRLNAAGRMEDAGASLRLLLTEDAEEAEQLAGELENFNQERQKTERGIVDEITAQLAADPELEDRRVLVVWGSGYHQGVIGIAASRLVARYGRPVIVFSVDGDEARGSGRSVPGFSLYNAIASCSGMLIRFGGHELAAGLSIRTADLPAFRDAINGWAARQGAVPDPPPIAADASIDPEHLTVEDVQSIERLAPFGNGNPPPVFYLENALLEAVYPLSGGKHTRLALRRGSKTLYAAVFGVSPESYPYHAGDRVDAMLSLSVYEAEKGPLISARAIALRPAGIGNDYLSGVRLYEKFRFGGELNGRERADLLPTRADVAEVFLLARREGFSADDLQPSFLRFGRLGSGRVLISIRILEELGLIEKQQTGTAAFYREKQTAEKKDLASAPTMRRLAAPDYDTADRT